ncbi:glutathione S-transferase [Maricaulis sp. W15]|uniref:glutathione S-transferase family protein n=1 Tax=Maricaulis sp. W15 TaxID=1772333 RepID=UPI000948A665|nr:glutathione S-transferase family protein [Maricaulis sp. W15]OLF75439.1 glutathione S-transferase [Maricaulis sp. W15]
MVDKSGLRLFHAPRTRSVRVRWLLEEMGLPYELEQVAFAQRPAGDEAYAEIHPLRKVPALEDKGRVMFESVAILQYLMGRYGPTELEVTPDEADYDLYLQWLHFGESGMLMPVTLLLAHTALLPEKARNPVIARSAKFDTVKVLAMLADHGLAGRDYLAANRFTAADISVGYMLFLLKIIKQLEDAPEAVTAYFARLTARPGWSVASAVDAVPA